jgi:hypothetical protein
MTPINRSIVSIPSHTKLLFLGLLGAGIAMPQTAIAGAGEDIVSKALARDVVLVPPVGEPVPAVGTFVRLYSAVEGQPADPNRIGMYEMAPSACSEFFESKNMTAAEKRSEVWKVKSGISASVGLPVFSSKGSTEHESVLGIEYNLRAKQVQKGGISKVTECCLRRPDTCTDRYVSEVWQGNGSLWSIDTSSKGLKAAFRAIPTLASVGFSDQQGWNRGSEWPESMYFAYRTSTLMIPSCKAYMNDLPAVEGKVLFSGISARKASEQEARRDARDDATQQLVRYLGQEYSIDEAGARSTASAMVKGIKDSLTCLDAVEDTVDGPRHLARVRMYVSEEKLQGN